MRKFLVTALLSLSLAAGSTSCIGTNNAFDSLKDWNFNVTENKWSNELIYLGLNIIPVYSIFLMGDVLIFNSIEFWGGDNPISTPARPSEMPHK